MVKRILVYESKESEHNVIKLGLINLYMQPKIGSIINGGILHASYVS